MQALANFPSLSPTFVRLEDRLARKHLYEVSNPEVMLGLVNALRNTAELHDNDAERFDAAMFLAVILCDHDRQTEGLMVAVTAVEQFGATVAPMRLASACYTIASMNKCAGDFAAAVEWCDKGKALIVPEFNMNTARALEVLRRQCVKQLARRQPASGRLMRLARRAA